MKRGPWTYTGILALLALAALLTTWRGAVLGIAAPGDIRLEASGASYTTDQTVSFLATLDFADQETATFAQVRLMVDGPAAWEASLPLEAGIHQLSAGLGPPGSLAATVELAGVSALEPASGAQAVQFKGIGQGASIRISANWDLGMGQPPPAGAYQARLRVELDDAMVRASNTVQFFIAQAVLCGDLTGDSLLDHTDFALALQIAVGMIPATPAQRQAGDLNRDGLLNIADAVLGLQHLSGRVPAFAGCGAE